MQKSSILFAIVFSFFIPIQADYKVSTQEAKQIFSEFAKKRAQMGINLSSRAVNVGVGTQKEAQQGCEDIMKHLLKNNLKEAFDTIKKLTWLPEEEINLVPLTLSNPKFNEVSLP